MGLVQRVRVSDIVSRTVLVKPPEPRAALLVPDALSGERAVYLGETEILRKPVFWRPEKLANIHIAIFGTTGFGKSTTIKAITTRMVMDFGVNVLILDFAGEYVHYAAIVGGHVISLGSRDYLNLMDLGGVPPSVRAGQVVLALQPFFDTERATRQARILRWAVERVYRDHGITDDPDTWDREPPTLKDVCSFLNGVILDAMTGEYKEKEVKDRELLDMLVRLEKSQSMRESAEGLLEKLEAFTKPPQDALARQSSIRLEDLLESGMVVLDLSGLPDEKHKTSVAISVLSFVVEYMRRLGEPNKEKIRALIVLDEAWKVVEQENSPVRPLIKEGRKYGIGVIVSTQEVVDADNYVVNNAGTIILHRLQEADNREKMSKALRLGERLREQFGKLDVGECIVNMSFAREKVDPFVVRVRPVPTHRTVKVRFRIPSSPVDKLMPLVARRYREVKRA